MFQRGETLDITEEGVVHENKLTTSPAFDSPNNKWSRQTSTPKSSVRTSLFGHTITSELSNLPINDDRNEISSNVEHDDDYDYTCMNQLLPDGIEFLRENEPLEQWRNLFELIFEKKFNPKQISYLLFLDVVKLLSAGNHRQIQYSEEVKQFWQIGMKLFHRNFLRFMTDEKSVMHLASKDPSSCFKLNFSLLSKHVLQANPLCNPSDMKPGVLNNILDAISEEEKEQTSSAWLEKN